MGPKLQTTEHSMQHSPTGLNRPLILHITGDYPDPSRTPTTVAIKRLIDGLTDCDHVIISLTRTADPRRISVQEYQTVDGQRLIAMHHFGLPFGGGLFFSFHAVADQIAKQLAERGLKPDLIHSHRLTFDGIAGWLLARRWRTPHVISVRGEVESKVLRFKPTYRGLMRRILSDAHRIYYVSAWFQPTLEQLAPNLRSALAIKSRPLPNIVANTCATIRSRPARPVILAVANLDISGFAKASSRLPGVSLEIIGGGSPVNVAAVQAIVDASGVADRIILRGTLDNDVFLEELPTALAMALPSHNETFGMVYTEALFAGVPILYGQATGIDGHLAGLEVGIGVPPGNVDAIAEGLIVLVERNGHLRRSIAASSPELFKRFDPNRLLALYMADVRAAVKVPAARGAIPALGS
jgi:glycosyltransferase involved in cell wall biosynthesis